MAADIGWEPIRNDMGQLTRPGFVEGAQLRYGVADLRFDHVVLEGKRFGVTSELAP